LNDPVGLMPSSLTQRSLAPIRAPNRLVWISGVIPSPSETIAAGFETGSTGAYRHMLKGAVRDPVAIPAFAGFLQIVTDQQRSAAFA
jgi:hypothetical protein